MECQKYVFTSHEGAYLFQRVTKVVGPMRHPETITDVCEWPGPSRRDFAIT